jgi:hypothetical protein
MHKFFAPNIDRRGRIARAIYGVVLIVGGLFLLRYSWWASVVLWIAGAFGLYEAKRGWCLMRACGIKTKL